MKIDGNSPLMFKACFNIINLNRLHLAVNLKYK